MTENQPDKAQSEYPESEKLDSAGVMTVVEFIEWLQDHGYYIATTNAGRLELSFKMPSTLINEWLGVDEKKLEAERRLMVERLMGGK